MSIENEGMGESVPSGSDSNPVASQDPNVPPLAVDEAPAADVAPTLSTSIETVAEVGDDNPKANGAAQAETAQSNEERNGDVKEAINLDGGNAMDVDVSESILVERLTNVSSDENLPTRKEIETDTSGQSAELLLQTAVQEKTEADTSNGDKDGNEIDPELKSLSISAGNSHIQWAFHAAPKEFYSPLLFWRTPHLPDRDGGPEKDPQVVHAFTELINDPAKATDTLTRHLPDTVQNYIFGEEEADNDPVEVSLKGPHKINIYIVSTTPHQLDALKTVWRMAECQCTIHVLDNTSFFDTEINKGVYASMGSDRLAALKGAISLYGLPALTVDGGTALTYTAADSTGRIMGGGISPGLRLRTGALHSCTAALPYISPEEAYYRIKGEISGKEDDPVNQAVLSKANDFPKLPMNLFSSSTEEAMIVSSFGEVGTWLRRVIGGWLHIVGPSKKKGGRGRKKVENSSLDTLISGKKVNAERHVVFTGGDAEVLMSLTSKFGEIFQVGSSNKKVIITGDSKIQDNIESADVGVLNHCNVVSRNNLVHYGVASLLAEKYSQHMKKSGKGDTTGVDMDNLNGLIGQRVAKRFAVLNTDGSHFFRGVVNEIYPDEQGDPLFGITYDDGDREHMNLSELRGKFVYPLRE